MRRARHPALPALLWLALASGAAAADFKSVGPGPAIMYDAPAQKSRKLHVAPAGMPVEIVFANGDWTRVRDASGDLSWMETRLLSPRRTFIVEVAQLTARAAANDNAPAVFTAAKGVLLELAEPISSAWIKVRHRDGETGYVKAAEIWGD
ncbi:MAG: SH3 domain-containing protein [Oxalobacteraceae bacterium]